MSHGTQTIGLSNQRAALARAFILAYERGDETEMLAFCEPDASTYYIPWGEAGRHPINEAVNFWSRYPAAFDHFAMPVSSIAEDREEATVIISTVNQGRQRIEIDGIENKARQMTCPHLFIIKFNNSERIRSVEIWCDQITIYRQLGFPRGFSIGGDV